MQTTTPPDPAALAARAQAMIHAGRPGAARPLLAALRQLDLDPAAFAGMAASLAIQENDLAAARAELDAGLAVAPETPALLCARADLRRRMGDLRGAAGDAAGAVIAAPADPAGKAILGVIMTELGRPADGAACLGEAVAAEPANPGFREALAAAQFAGGDPEAAAATLARGIAVAPGRIELRNAAVLLAVRRQRFDEALDLAEAARQEGHADACLFGLKAHALSSLGRSEEAGEAYAEALKLGPADPYVRHLAAAAGALPGRSRAPDDYLRAVFDSYATRFESSLIGLGYRIPGLIRLALQRHARLPASGLLGPALDLGCGTGLIAVALHGLPVGPIHGIDISARMLDIAAAKQLYASLREADLMQALTEPGPGFQLIFAADVLCYFGALAPLFPAVFDRLTPGGLFLCSAEDLPPHQSDGQGWRLGPLGRYAHAAGYLADTARQAGFDIVALEAETIRHEAIAPVHGRFAVLRRLG